MWVIHGYYATLVSVCVFVSVCVSFGERESWNLSLEGQLYFFVYFIRLSTFSYLVAHSFAHLGWMCILGFDVRL